MSTLLPVPTGSPEPPPREHPRALADFDAVLSGRSPGSDDPPLPLDLHALHGGAAPVVHAPLARSSTTDPARVEEPTWTALGGRAYGVPPTAEERARRAITRRDARRLRGSLPDAGADPDRFDDPVNGARSANVRPRICGASRLRERASTARGLVEDALVVAARLLHRAGSTVASRSLPPVSRIALAVLLVLGSCTWALVSATAPAHAAEYGPGFGDYANGGERLGAFRMGEANIYCLEPSRPPATGTTASAGVADAARLRMPPETVARINWAVSTHGQADDAATAAAVQLYVWSTAAPDHYESHGMPGDDFYLQRVPEDEREDVRSRLAEIRDGAEAVGSPTPHRGSGSLEFSTDAGNPLLGAVRAVTDTPGSTGEVTLTGATFAETGEARMRMSSGQSAKIQAAPSALREGRLTISGRGAFEQPDAAWSAELEVFETPGAQLLGGSGGRTPQTFAVEGRDAAPREAVFRPTVTTRVAEHVVALGAPLEDRWTIGLEGPGAWPTDAHGIHVPVRATAQLFGPFDEAPETAAEVPAGAPLAAELDVALGGTKESPVGREIVVTTASDGAASTTAPAASAGPGASSSPAASPPPPSTTPSSSTPGDASDDDGQRVAALVEPADSGFYTWVVTIDAAAQLDADPDVRSLMPTGYRFVDGFGLEAETAFVAPRVTTVAAATIDAGATATDTARIEGVVPAGARIVFEVFAEAQAGEARLDAGGRPVDDGSGRALIWTPEEIERLGAGACEAQLVATTESTGVPAGRHQALEIESPAVTLPTPGSYRWVETLVDANGVVLHRGRCGAEHETTIVRTPSTPPPPAETPSASPSPSTSTPSVAPALPGSGTTPPSGAAPSAPQGAPGQLATTGAEADLLLPGALFACGLLAAGALLVLRRRRLEEERREEFDGAEAEGDDEPSPWLN